MNNSVGDKVEIIISDVKSYLCSMNYMLAFNKAEDIVWFWDEPTITLDYTEHPFHNILKNNWKQNTIPNVILSSATLQNKMKYMVVYLVLEVNFLCLLYKKLPVMNVKKQFLF